MVSPSSSSGNPRFAAHPDAFGLLGLAPRFDIDAATLERAYFERSKELHPDRFATAPVAERVAALSKARALNDAYQLLKKDASRAEYLLAHAGLTIGDNERIDPALVMELLEDREVLAEARARGDLARVEALCASMRSRRRAALDEVRARFAAVDAARPGESRGEDGRATDLAAIKQQLILLRYVDRYLEECDAALDEG